MKQLFLLGRDLAGSVAGISWADMDRGQLNADTPNIPAAAALIKTAILNTSQTSFTDQICKATISIRVWVDDVTPETSNKAPQIAVARSLAYYDIAEAVYNKFQGYRDEVFSAFQLQSYADEERIDGKTVCRLVFSTSFEKAPVKD